MTEIVYQPDRVAQAQALWTPQFLGKSTIDAITDVLTAESQELENVYAQLRLLLDIDSQTGINLDRIGVLVGQPREGRLDSVYRLWLKARIRVNRSSGSPVDMYEVAQILLGTDTSLYLEQVPVGHVMHALEYVSADPISLQRILQQTSAIAVPLWYSYSAGDYDRFTLDGTTAQALDNGRFVDWLGPDQSFNRHAYLQEVMRYRLVASWDCRDYLYEMQEARGVGPTLYPYEHALADDIVPDTTLVKESVAGILLGETRALSTTNSSLLGVFGTTNAWTVAFGIRKDEFTNSVIELSNSPDVEAGSTLQKISISVSGASTGVTLGRIDGLTVKSMSSGVAVSSAFHSVVVSYDGAGNAYFWVDGTKYTDSDTHDDVSVDHFLWSDFQVAGDEDDNFAAFGLCVIDRVVTDTEAQKITQHYLREFTDAGYY